MSPWKSERENDGLPVDADHLGRSGDGPAAHQPFQGRLLTGGQHCEVGVFVGIVEHRVSWKAESLIGFGSKRLHCYSLFPVELCEPLW